MLEVLYQYGPFTLRTFNFFLVLGFLSSGLYLLKYIELKNLNIHFFYYNSIYLLLSAFLGGRLFTIFENFSFYFHYPLSMFFIWDMNFSFFGLLIGLITSLFFLCKQNHESFWSWFDLATIGMLPLMFFIFIGYFFSGAHYGQPTNLPWGVTFDMSYIPYTTPIHPVQLYIALMILVLFLYAKAYTKRVHLPGVVGNRTLMVYSLGIFLLSFLESNVSLFYQVELLLLTVFAFVYYIYTSHKKITFNNQ